MYSHEKLYKNENIANFVYYGKTRVRSCSFRIRHEFISIILHILHRRASSDGGFDCNVRRCADYELHLSNSVGTGYTVWMSMQGNGNSIHKSLSHETLEFHNLSLLV